MATRYASHARDLPGISPHRLIALRRAGRRAILIVDADCGDGRRLIDAAARARALGFVAIEAKGFDKSDRHIATATDTASRHCDPAIGFRFEIRADGAPLSLAGDEDGQADLMLANIRRPAAELVHAIDRDGVIIHQRR